MTDRVEVLERLAKLRAEGVLGEEEFAFNKRLVLDVPASALTPAGARSGVSNRALGWTLGGLTAVLAALGVYLVTPRPVLLGTSGSATNQMDMALNQTEPEPAPTAEPVVKETAAADDDFRPATDEDYAANLPTVTITDRTLAAEYKQDGAWGPDNSSDDGACAGLTMAIKNSSSKPLTLTIGPEDASSPDVQLGTLQPGADLRLKMGKVGFYVIGHVVEDSPGPVELFRTHVDECIVR